jgi:hypothetical protein
MYSYFFPVFPVSYMYSYVLLVFLLFPGEQKYREDVGIYGVASNTWKK